MADKTLIAWTDHTFNIAWGCTKISPGCTHCYAETLSRRFGWDVWGREATRRTFAEKHWQKPVLWDEEAAKAGQRRRVFSSSMCDLFEDHPVVAAEREKLWELIRRTPWLDWQLLTKRADRIGANLPSDWRDGYPNVWLGVSIESNDYVERADHLREIPATIRFISYEPALGPLPDLDLTGIHWVIYGGESGPKYRDHDLEWPRVMKARCEAAGVAFFYKQSAAIRTEMGIELDGAIVRNYPRG